MKIASELSIFLRLLGLSLGLLLLQPGGAVGGVITFSDLTDSVGVTFSSDLAGRAFAGPDCFRGEVCTVMLLPPIFTGEFGSGVRHINIFDRVSGLQRRAEPEEALSDTSNLTFSSSPSVPLFVLIVFSSDTDDGLLQPLGPPQFPWIETGEVQGPIHMVTWGNCCSDLIIDTVFFQSDVINVAPEPSSILLMSIGLVLVTLRCRRRVPDMQRKYNDHR
jgi:hypothetical protein